MELLEFCSLFSYGPYLFCRSIFSSHDFLREKIISAHFLVVFEEEKQFLYLGVTICTD